MAGWAVEQREWECGVSHMGLEVRRMAKLAMRSSFLCLCFAASQYKSQLQHGTMVEESRHICLRTSLWLLISSADSDAYSQDSFLQSCDTEHTALALNVNASRSLCVSPALCYDTELIFDYVLSYLLK